MMIVDALIWCSFGGWCFDVDGIELKEIQGFNVCVLPISFLVLAPVGEMHV